MKEYKELIKNTKNNKSNSIKLDFLTNIRIGSELKDFVNPVKSYKQREILKNIEEYIYNNTYDKVFILYGLRRTGKTTMLR